MDRRVDLVFKAVPEERSRPMLERRMVAPPRNFRRQSPFLQLTEDSFDATGGFGRQARRGFEMVTLVLEGTLERTDPLGGSARLSPGDVHWLTAGRGCECDERAAGRGATRLLQLWLNLPATQKMVAPCSFDQRAASVPTHLFEGGEVRVYAGTSGAASREHPSRWPLVLLDITLRSGYEHEIRLPAAFRGLLYVLQGRGRLGSAATEVRSGDAAWSEPGAAGALDTLRLAATSDVRAVLFAAPPINEPVALYGQFVMNTMAEIEAAYADYRAGRFCRATHAQASLATAGVS